MLIARLIAPFLVPAQMARRRARDERAAVQQDSSSEEEYDEATPLTAARSAASGQSFGWAETSVPACLVPLLRLDLEAARALRQWTKDSVAPKVFSEVLSLSGDEAIWFGVGGVSSLLFLLRLLGVLRSSMSCQEELGFELYGASALCILAEQLLKLVFQRDRPPWAAAQKRWVVPAEWLSFPSGHALRAFCKLCDHGINIHDHSTISNDLAHSSPPSVWDVPARPLLLARRLVAGCRGTPRCFVPDHCGAAAVGAWRGAVSRDERPALSA